MLRAGIPRRFQACSVSRSTFETLDAMSTNRLGVRVLLACVAACFSACSESGGGGSATDAGIDSGRAAPCTGSKCAGPACVSNPSLCGKTEVCDPRADASTGCVPGRVCANDRDCEDMDPCTQSLGCDRTTALC